MSDCFKAHEISEEGVNFQMVPEQVLPNLMLQDLDLVFVTGVTVFRYRSLTGSMRPCCALTESLCWMTLNAPGSVGVVRLPE